MPVRESTDLLTSEKGEVVVVVELVVFVLEEGDGSTTDAMGWEEGGTNVVVGWVEGTGGSNSALGLPAMLPAPLWHWKEGNPPRFLEGVSGKHVVG